MRYVASQHLEEGMFLAKSLYSKRGRILLREGRVITDNIIKRLSAMSYPGVYINDKLSEGIEIKDVISEDLRHSASVAVGHLLNGLETGSVATLDRDMHQITQMLNQIVDEIMQEPAAIVNLIDLKEFDAYTHQHSVNVCVLACIIGAVHGLSRDEMYNLALAGILHDIGKIFVGKGILNKPGKLDPEEFEVVKTHSALGSELVFEKCDFAPSVSTAILHHHERFDGNGYPLRKSGDDIVLYGQIIAIADVYDAFTSKRPHREAALPSEAYEYIMGNSGQAFSPALVDVFSKKIAPYPVGIRVELSNGLAGIVFSNRGGALTRPVIRIEPPPGESEPVFVDLSDAAFSNVTIRKVLT